jgi:hypothetical protein
MIEEVEGSLKETPLQTHMRVQSQSRRAPKTLQGHGLHETPNASCPTAQPISRRSRAGALRCGFVVSRLHAKPPGGATPYDSSITPVSPTGWTLPDQQVLTCYFMPALDWRRRPWTVSTTCAMRYHGGRSPSPRTTDHIPRSGPVANQLGFTADHSAHYRGSEVKARAYHEQTKNLLGPGCTAPRRSTLPVPTAAERQGRTRSLSPVTCRATTLSRSIPDARVQRSVVSTKSARDR